MNDERRATINNLIGDAILSFVPAEKAAAASVLALLEVADAIHNLAAEVERAGWEVKTKRHDPTAQG